MAEAIMVFYAPNSWSYFLSHKTKENMHWILQLTGALCIITGNIIISVIRTTPHFESIHSVTGNRTNKSTNDSLSNFIVCLRFDLNDFVGNKYAARNLGLFRFPITCKNETDKKQILAQCQFYFMLRYRYGELNFWQV